MELNEIHKELENFISSNKDHVGALMGAMNSEATPQNLVAAYAGIGPSFAHSLAAGAAEFTGLDGTPAGPDKISKWLETAAQLIITGKGIREAALGKNGSPSPAPVVIQPSQPAADQKIFGLPKGLFALVVLVLLLVVTLIAVKGAKHANG